MEQYTKNAGCDSPVLILSAFPERQNIFDTSMMSLSAGDFIALRLCMGF